MDLIAPDFHSRGLRIRSATELVSNLDSERRFINLEMSYEKLAIELVQYDFLDNNLRKRSALHLCRFYVCEFQLQIPLFPYGKCQPTLV